LVPPFFFREFEEGGNCIWYNEPGMLAAVEKRLGSLKVTQLALPDLKLPAEIEKMMKNGGYGEYLGEGAENPLLALHLEQLKGDVRTLGVLEFQLQSHFLRMQKRREGTEGGGEDIDLMAMEVEEKHASSGFGR